MRNFLCVKWKMIVQPPSFDEMSKRVVWISRTGRWRIQWRKLLFIWCWPYSTHVEFNLFTTWNKSNIVSKCHQKLSNNENIIFVFVMSNRLLLLHTILHPLLDNFFLKWIQSPHPTFGMFWKAKNKILPYHWPIKKLSYSY